MSVRRRRIRWLFRASSLLTIGALVAVALVAMRTLAVSHLVATQAARADLAALEDATGLQELLYQKGFITEYFLTNDPRWLGELERTTPKFEEWLARVNTDAQTPDAAKVSASLAAEYGRWDVERAQAVKQYQTGDQSGAIAAVAAYADRTSHLRDLANHLIRIRRHEVAERLEATDRTWHQALVALTLTVLLAILGAALIGYFVARRVARPLYELVLRAESAADGAKVEINAEDEIGALSEHVARLARQIESSSSELAEHRAKLSQAEKMVALGEMATGVAHEVLNPLTGVKTAVRLLTRTSPTSVDLAETAQAVDAEIRRVETLAQRLISFARPFQPRVERCDLNDLFLRVAQAARVESTPRNVRVEPVLHGVSTIQADPDLLAQVLINLVVNACQAMKEGGTVQMSAHLEGEGHVLEVRDDGPGVAKEIASRLFTPFVTNRADGHGLGLAISQNIVLAHGGRMEMSSNAPARGTTFKVWLPGALS